MALAQRLDMRQSQQLVMTPQLQQAIKMLQMSNLELREFIADALDSNPLLDVAPADGPTGSALDGPTDGRAAAAAEPADAPSGATSSEERSGDGGAGGEEVGGGEPRLETEVAEQSFEQVAETFDTGSENLFADVARADAQAEGEGAGPHVEGPGGPESGWSTVGKGGQSSFDDPDFGLEGRLTEEETLREHLLAQLGVSGAGPAEKLIAIDIIENLDEAGYCRADLDELADRLGATDTQVAAALALVQSFEPSGVGARTLQECLAIQLRERDRFDPAMQCFLENVELFASRDLEKLRKKCGVDAEDFREMIAEVRALDPKPGRRYDHDVAQTLFPDVFVRENENHGWTVELNSETLPRLLVNASYAAEIGRPAGGGRGDENKRVKEFLVECQQNASWLIKSIDQRAKTILRVATEIVKQQDDFLAYGIAGLKPLNLKQIADAIEMHESTVSRVTSNKYMSTPRGIFEFKYFFTPAIASTHGDESYSAESIRHRIKTLIDGESCDDVLSDDRIVTILKRQGVDIARRTVAKYREALNIPSSVKRRKEKTALTVF